MKIDVKEIRPTYVQVLLGADRILVTNRKCVVCKMKFYHGISWQGQPYSEHAKVGTAVDNNCCSRCQFWSEKAMNSLRGQDSIVIDRKHYEATTDTMFNFAGREFTIEYADGRRVTTMLSGQGAIPNEFADALPDNARFLDEAVV